MSIDKEIEECKKRIDRLAVLLADGKISEQSYATATRTLESRMESLKKAKENPDVLTSSSGVESFEDASFERPTSLWYLVPFFFGIIGGLIGYVAVKDEDKSMADSLLVFGLVWTVILAIVYWVLITSMISNLPV
jgi:multidrug resistance efflux pump